MGLIDKTNVIVNGSQSILSAIATYTTKVLKPNVIDGVNVLTQDMMSHANTKYVIHWDYDLQGATITVPEGCLIEFDGGSIANGTLVGQNTILIYNQPLSEILTATLEGTWRHESGVKADEEDITDKNGELKFKDKEYDTENFSGLGRVYLRKNIVNGKNVLTQSMLNKANTIYVIQYDYDLGNEQVTNHIGESHITIDATIYYYAAAQVIPVNCTAKAPDGYTFLRLNPQIPGSAEVLGDTVTANTDNFEVHIASAVTYNIDVTYDILSRPVTIPENCVLKFEGGSLSGGTVDFNNCVIKAEDNLHVFKNLSNFLNLPKCSIKWFGAKGDADNDDTEIFKFLCNRINSYLDIYVPAGVYKLTESINPNGKDDDRYTMFSLTGDKKINLAYGDSMTIEDYLNYPVSVLYYIGNSSDAVIYSPHGLYNFYILGQSKRVQTYSQSYYNLVPKYDNTIAIAIYNYEVSASPVYAKQVSIENVKIRLFGTAIYQGASFSLYFNNISIYRNYYGWNIDVQDGGSIPIQQYITHMFARNVNISASVYTGLRIYGGNNSKITFDNITVEHSNFGNTENNYEINVIKGLVEFHDLYCEHHDSDSEIIRTKVNINQSGGFLYMISPSLYDGTYNFSSYIGIVNSRSIKAIVNCTGAGFIENCSFFYLSASSAIRTENVRIEDVTHNVNTYDKSSLFYNTGLSLSEFETKYSERNNSPFGITTDQGKTFIGKVGDTTRRIPYYDSDLPLFKYDAPSMSGITGDNKGRNTFDTHVNRPLWWDGSDWRDADGALHSTRRWGNTNQVPTNNELGVHNAGFIYYNGSLSRMMFWAQTQFMSADGYSIASILGSSSNRPIGKHLENGVQKGELSSSDKGYTYWDTTLNKRIYAKTIDDSDTGTGTVIWIEADGAAAGVRRAGLITKRPALADIYSGFLYTNTNAFEIDDTPYPAGVWAYAGASNWITPDGNTIGDDLLPTRA